MCLSSSVDFVPVATGKVMGTQWPKLYAEQKMSPKLVAFASRF